MADRGFNVIGHVSANLGLGVIARQVIAVIEARGDAVSVFDIDAGYGRSGKDARYERLSVETLEDLPYEINIFVVSLASLKWILPRCPASFFGGRLLNAAVCFWELPLLPYSLIQLLDRMDVVVGTSEFMTATFQISLSNAVTIAGRLPVTLPPIVEFSRARLGIPDSAVQFVCGFEPASDPARKNPYAAIEAFRSGTEGRDDAYLVIKVNNARDSDGKLAPIVADLEALCSGHPRIRIVTEPMTYPEVLGLYRASDVLVALHRSEGLGLAMAEAMVLGRVVIATGWSGNMTFMDQTNAYLVGYRLVPVQGSVGAYLETDTRRRARWAEPSVAEAAALMRILVRDRAARLAVGERAAASMAAFNRAAANGSFLDQLLTIRARQGALREAGFQRVLVPTRAPRISDQFKDLAIALFDGLEWRIRRVLRLSPRHG